MKQTKINASSKHYFDCVMVLPWCLFGWIASPICSCFFLNFLSTNGWKKRPFLRPPPRMTFGGHFEQLDKPIADLEKTLATPRHVAANHATSDTIEFPPTTTITRNHLTNGDSDSPFIPCITEHMDPP